MSNPVPRFGGPRGAWSDRWVSWLTLAAGAVMCLGAVLLS
jgi:hypothetical protein